MLTKLMAHGLHECIFCHKWNFLKKKINFQPDVCNGCHDLMQNAIIFNDVAIVAMKRSNSIIYFWCMSKDKAINLFKNADFTEKKWNIKNKNLLTHIKLVKEFQRFVIFKLKNVNFIKTKALFHLTSLKLIK